MRTCFTTVIAGFSITLSQKNRNNFSVVYGKDEKHSLTYEQATGKLGQAIMHALTLEEKIIWE